MLNGSGIIDQEISQEIIPSDNGEETNADVLGGDEPYSPRRLPPEETSDNEVLGGDFLPADDVVGDVLDTSKQSNISQVMYED